MGDELVDLDERARVQQQVEPLAGGQLALGVLGADARFAAALAGLLAQRAQMLDLLVLACMPGSVSLAIVGHLAQDLLGHGIRILLAGSDQREARFPVCAARQLLEPPLDAIFDDRANLAAGTVGAAQVPGVTVFEIRAVLGDALDEIPNARAFGCHGLLDWRRPPLARGRVGASSADRRPGGRRQRRRPC